MWRCMIVEAYGMEHDDERSPRLVHMVFFKKENGIKYIKMFSGKMHKTDNKLKQEKDKKTKKKTNILR